MRILALDTSTSQGGVAVVQNSELDSSPQVLARAVWRREKSHTEFLTPTIEKVLSEAGLTLAQIDAFAIGNGPGSFTGIRIGVNVVRALAYSLSKPIYVFNTLEILAAGVDRHDLPVLTLVNAHKNLLFAVIYDWQSAAAGAAAGSGAGNGHWVPRGEVRALTLDELTGLVQEPILCVGDGYLEFESLFPIDLKQYLVRASQAPVGTHLDDPLPEVLGRLAVTNRAARPPIDWNALQALYVRASGAEESLEMKRRG